jgi:uncharacterized protein YbjT (DUF2867 family)
VIALVTGGTGTLGRRVARELLSRGHATRVLTRDESPASDGETRVLGDVTTGAGLSDALDEADVVFHCATDNRRHKEVDRDGTARLLDVAQRASRPLIVYPGIVGSDVIPLGYYASKEKAEETIARSGLAWIVLRSTQFHQLIWWLMGNLARPPLMVVPNDTRAQPIDPSAVARAMVDAAEGGARGRLPDLGGPTAYSTKDLAGSYLAATGKKRRVIQINVPGIVGAAFRAGANLTPNRDDSGKTWNEFVAEVATGR